MIGLPINSNNLLKLQKQEQKESAKLMFRTIIGLLKYQSQIRLIFYTHYQVHKKLKNKKNGIYYCQR